MKMRATEFATRICEDLVREAISNDRHNFIVTRFHYPDGDLVNMYLEHRDDGLFVTDHGETLYKFQINGLDWETDSRVDWIKSVCTLHQLEFPNGREFRKRVRFNNASVDCLAFCEAITQIATISYDRNAAPSVRLGDEVGFLLESRVAPFREVVPNWTSLIADPNEDWPVDFHVQNKRNQPQNNGRNLFVIGNANRTVNVCATINALRVGGVEIPSMAIVSPEIKLGGKSVSRLNSVASVIVTGVEGNESAIEAFALGKVA